MYANRFYNLSHALCYSYGTDKNYVKTVKCNTGKFVLENVMFTNYRTKITKPLKCFLECLQVVSVDEQIKTRADARAAAAANLHDADIVVMVMLIVR